MYRYFPPCLMWGGGEETHIGKNASEVEVGSLHELSQIGGDLWKLADKEKSQTWDGGRENAWFEIPKLAARGGTCHMGICHRLES